MHALIRTLAWLLLFCAGAAQANDVARQRIESIAAAIETNYFDAGKGKEIADGLRAAAAKGEFDEYSRASELAVAVTERLQPQDAHFLVHLASKKPKRKSRGSGFGGVGGGSGGGAYLNLPQDGNDTGITRVEILPGGIGYLVMSRFAHFEFDQPSEVRTAINDALQKLSSSKAVIIDLRGNGGGSSNMVGYLISAFVKPGSNVYNEYRSRNGNRSEAPKREYFKPRTNVPLYVLIDSGIGPEAESFAYALQQAGRATLVGERTTGMLSSPTASVPAGTEFMLMITVGSPVNPISGTSWEGEGVRPDVRAEGVLAFDKALSLARQAVR